MVSSNGSPPQSPDGITLTSVSGLTLDTQKTTLCDHQNQQQLLHKQEHAYNSKPVIICSTGTGGPIRILPYNNGNNYIILYSCTKLSLFACQTAKS